MKPFDATLCMNRKIKIYIKWFSFVDFFFPQMHDHLHSHTARTRVCAIPIQKKKIPIGSRENENAQYTPMSPFFTQKTQPSRERENEKNCVFCCEWTPTRPHSYRQK